MRPGAADDSLKLQAGRREALMVTSPDPDKNTAGVRPVRESEEAKDVIK